MAKVIVQNKEVSIIKSHDEDYISLTDMANAKEGESRAADIIKNWLRNRYTLEFIGTWEEIYNPNLKWSNLTTLNHRLVCQALF